EDGIRDFHVTGVQTCALPIFTSGRVHSGRLLLRFEGVHDRTAAEALRNTLLIAEVDPDELPEEEDEFYDHQLIDLDVVTVDGTQIGRASCREDGRSRWRTYHA